MHTSKMAEKLKKIKLPQRVEGELTPDFVMGHETAVEQCIAVAEWEALNYVRYITQLKKEMAELEKIAIKAYKLQLRMKISSGPPGMLLKFGDDKPLAEAFEALSPALMNVIQRKVYAEQNEETNQS